MSEFTLTIFSSKPVEVQQLEDSKNAVLTGRWTEDSAGGCHLFDSKFEKKEELMTWMNNPKYSLKLHTTNPVDVKITLSRPEKIWKKKIAKSSVACMMGMYIYKKEENYQRAAALNEIKFLPTNQISVVSPIL